METGIIVQQEQILSLKNPSTTRLISCLVSNNPIELISIESELNITLATNGTSLRKLEKSIGKINIVKSITFLITRLAENFNVGKNLTTEQASVLAFDFVELYPNETIEDFILMFKYVRQGVIGDGKDFKLDGQNVLHKWVPEYLNKKSEALELAHQKQMSELNSTTLSEEIVDRFYEKRRIAKQKAEFEKRVLAYIDKITNGISRIRLEEIIEEWEKDDEKKQYIRQLKKKRLLIKS